MKFEQIDVDILQSPRRLWWSPPRSSECST